jgi:ligand-binding sensor domain-containing protein
LWLLDEKAFHPFDPISGILGIPIPIINPSIRAIYCDALGLIWISTNDGIFLASKKPKYFNSFLTDQVSPVSCRGFTEDRQGNLYAFTLSGVFTFPRRALSSNEPLKPKKLFAIAAIIDSDDQIWYTSESSACAKFNPSTGEVKYYDFNIETPNYFVTWSIHQIQSGQILLGSTSGLWIKDPRDDSPPIRFNQYNGYTVLDQSTIYNILETTEGIWLSTDNGLFLVDMQKGCWNISMSRVHICPTITFFSCIRMPTIYTGSLRVAVV